MTTPTWRRGCMKRNQRKIPPNIWVFFFGFGFQPTSSLRQNQDAGTHSGDATLLLPSQRLHLETHRRVMHIAAQLPEPWVRSDIPFTGRFFLNLLATKIHLQLGNQYGINMETGPFLLLVFFVPSHQNSWREHHLFFFPQKVQSSQHFWPLQCAVYVPGQLLRFPTRFSLPSFFGRWKCQEGSSSSVRAVKVIECNVRASRTVPPMGS